MSSATSSPQTRTLHIGGLTCFTSGMWRDLAISAWRHGSNTVKCHFAVAHRGSGLLQGLIHGGGEQMEQESQLKVRLQGSWRQFTGYALIFDMNQMYWCDCLPHFCKWENKSIKGICIPASPNVNSKHKTGNKSSSWCCCTNEITKHCKFGSAVLEMLLQAIVAKQQLRWLNVRVGILEGAQRTTKVYLELNIFARRRRCWRKYACRTKTSVHRSLILVPPPQRWC